MLPLSNLADTKSLSPHNLMLRLILSVNIERSSSQIRLHIDIFAFTFVSTLLVLPGAEPKQALCSQYNAIILEGKFADS